LQGFARNQFKRRRSRWRARRKVADEGRPQVVRRSRRNHGLLLCDVPVVQSRIDRIGLHHGRGNCRKCYLVDTVRHKSGGIGVGTVDGPVVRGNPATGRKRRKHCSEAIDAGPSRFWA
jgi:hypothetical protein